MLYRGGADINITSKNGIGSLYLAIKANNIECVRYLVERKAAPHFVDSERIENSPVFFCIKQGNLKIVEALCDGKVNMDIIKDKDGYSPLTYAAKNNLLNIVFFFCLCFLLFVFVVFVF